MSDNVFLPVTVCLGFFTQLQWQNKFEVFVSHFKIQEYLFCLLVYILMFVFVYKIYIKNVTTLYKHMK